MAENQEKNRDVDIDEVVDNMTLMDDDFMSKAFDGNIPATGRLLRTILGREDIEVISVVGQMELQNPLVGGRMIRLDIVAEDRDGVTCDVEVQRKKDAYFVGIDEDKDGFLKTLSILEDVYGVVACKSDENRYQWAEPNSWAPLNYIAVAAAQRLGLQDDARRLVDKYLLVTENIFDKTERLWEKFNAKTGDLEVASEYGTPEMLGWSAGVYIAFYEYRKTGYKNLL